LSFIPNNEDCAAFVIKGNFYRKVSVVLTDKQKINSNYMEAFYES